MEERRTSQRLRTYLGGRIEFDQRFPSINCLVRNLSQNGARLVFSEPVATPATFDLHINDKSESWNARIIWRDETHVGVALTSSDPVLVVSIETAHRIKTLEAERDALVKRVCELGEPAQ